MKTSITTLFLALVLYSCMTTGKATRLLEKRQALSTVCKDRYPCITDTLYVVTEFDEDWEEPPCVHDVTGCTLCPGALDSTGKTVPAVPLNCPPTPKPRTVRTTVYISVKDSAATHALERDNGKLQSSLLFAESETARYRSMYEACLATGRSIGKSKPSLKLLWAGLLVGFVIGIVLKGALSRR